MAQLEIRNGSCRFSDFMAVRNVSLNVETGKFFILLAPSDCGVAALSGIRTEFQLR